MSETDEASDSTLSELAAELRAQRVEIQLLRAELTALRARRRRAPDSEDAEDAEDADSVLHLTSRRRFFALAGGAAALAAAGVASSGDPAAALTGDPLRLGAQTQATTGAVGVETYLDYYPSASPTVNRSYFQVSDTLDPLALHPAAITGQASRVPTGVYGSTARAAGNGVVGRAKPGTGTSAFGVWGLAATGAGIAAESASGIDVLLRGTGRLHFATAVTPSGPPVTTTTAFGLGEIVRDGTGKFYACVVGGSPGVWKRLQFVEDLPTPTPTPAPTTPTAPVATTGPLTGAGAPVGVTAMGGAAALKLLPAAGTPPAARTDAHAFGEVDIDSSGNVWLCVADGTPGLWRKLAGPATAGAFHAIDPFRAFDSRWPGNAPLQSDTSIIVSVSDARDLGGNVSIANSVPVGASAVAFNLTVTQTVNAGFLTVAPGATTVVGASSINWASSGLNVANGLIVGLDPSRQVKVFAGGGGSTDFIIDVSGYFL